MLSIEEKRKIWLNTFEENKEAMNGRVKSDIEKHRKGWCKLRFLDKNGNPIRNARVKIIQKTHDFKFGAHIFMLDEFETEEKNKAYREIFKDYFNLATVPIYWDALEPEQGKLRFDKNSEKIYRRPATELCLEYCEENSIDAKMHCLVYDKFIPDWLPKKDLKAMETLYEERIRAIAERYAGRLYEIEATNETFCAGNWTTQSVISEKRDLIEWSFRLARKYFPFDTLVINEGNPIPDLYSNNYRSPYFIQIEKALLKGAEIDKIGLQNHIFPGVRAGTPEEYDLAVKNGAEDCLLNPSKVLKGLDIIAELGLPLEFTEVTFPTFGDTEEDEIIQAEILKNMYSIWFSHPAVESIVYWNTVDGYCYVENSGDSAIAKWDENRVRGGLFHHDLTPKKSAIALKKLLTEEWHTETELKTDENGTVEFRGFYGEYEADINNLRVSFAVHKNGNHAQEIMGV